MQNADIKTSPRLPHTEEAVFINASLQKQPPNTLASFCISARVVPRANNPHIDPWFRLKMFHHALGRLVEVGVYNHVWNEVYDAGDRYHYSVSFRWPAGDVALNDAIRASSRIPLRGNRTIKVNKYDKEGRIHRLIKQFTADDPHHKVGVACYQPDGAWKVEIVDDPDGYWVENAWIYFGDRGFIFHAGSRLRTSQTQPPEDYREAALRDVTPYLHSLMRYRGIEPVDQS